MTPFDKTRSYGLPKYEANLLIDDFHGGSVELANYFEACMWVADNLAYLALWYITQLNQEDIPDEVATYPKYFVETFDQHRPTPTQVAKFILNEMKAQAKKFKMDVWKIPPQFTILLLLLRRSGAVNNKKIQELVAQEYAHVDESAF